MLKSGLKSDDGFKCRDEKQGIFKGVLLNQGI